MIPDLRKALTDATSPSWMLDYRWSDEKDSQMPLAWMPKATWGGRWSSHNHHGSPLCLPACQIQSVRNALRVLRSGVFRGINFISDNKIIPGWIVNGAGGQKDGVDWRFAFTDFHCCADFKLRTCYPIDPPASVLTAKFFGKVNQTWAQCTNSLSSLCWLSI